MPKPRVYIETTVVSVLTARPSRDLVQSAWQQITSEWWETRRSRYVLLISQQVLTEASRGDVEAIQRRLAAMIGIAQLDITEEVLELATALARSLKLPPKKAADAIHIAVASVHQIAFLATWNCTHLANPVLERKAKDVCVSHGYICPMIVTPHQLLEINL
ncbi:MAG: PIN domain-containing protein [Pedosphaera sp.]|nr:PIN domain-containing protein [Pedosphaera sp.]